MDDFTYESIQRKRLAKNAIHKKNGSKSKKCTLPTDGMSRKDWEEKNGEVKAFNLNEPMSWTQFKEMPLDLQQEYLAFLVDNFKVGSHYIGEMFGTDPRTLKKWISDHELNVTLPKNGGALTANQNRRWEMFIAGEDWTTVSDSIGIMSWEGFKSLPREEQQQYLQNVIDTYNATQQQIADAMGVKGNTISTHCKKYQLDIHWKNNPSGGKRVPVEVCPDFDVLAEPRPISWGQFKALPRETQGKYLQNMVDKYSASTINLGKMFGVDPSTVSGYAIYHDLQVTFRPKGLVMSKEEKKRWDCFIAGEEYQEPTETIDISEPAVEPPEPIVTEKEEPKITTDISITLKGDINVDELVSLMKSLLGDASRGTLNFTFQKEETV